jgi:hypothetical protein
MLFAGGCHVNGYPFKRDDSFSVKVVDHLVEEGYQVSVETLGPLKLSHVAELEDAVERVRPGALLLQLGNFETTRALSDWISLAVTGKLRHRSMSSASCHSPFATPSGRLKWRARAFIKLKVDTLLRSPLVDGRSIYTEAKCLVSRIAALVDGSVFLVGPLPCADPTILRYRERHVAAFSTVAAEVGVPFLDPIGQWVRAGRPIEIFHDSTHLNCAGHDWLSRIILDCFEAGICDTLRKPVARHIGHAEPRG